MKYQEINIDSLVSPSHSYGGMALGNLASTRHRAKTSNPKQAALQGLDKMLFLHKKGTTQLILPPHPRPYLPLMRHLGYTGCISSCLKELSIHDPELLYALYSSSGMWTANSATVSPSCDTKDGKLHLSIANLSSNLHRSIEAPFWYHVFKKVFSDEDLFSVHAPLEPASYFPDEGAANTLRLWSPENQSKKGLEIFCYSFRGYQLKEKYKANFPSRQAYQASFSIAKKHGVEKSLFIEQNPECIEKGVFHNDVISLSHENLLFYHEKSFVNPLKTIEEIKNHCDFPLYFVEVKEVEISLQRAVKSYLFNSQLLSINKNNMLLLCPEECFKDKVVFNYIEKLMKMDNPISQVHFFPLKQSMQNGGGPACLRLRVYLNEKELNAISPSFILDDKKYESLRAFIEKNYPESLSLKELKNPKWGKICLDLLEKMQYFWELDHLYPKEMLMS